MIDWLKAPYFPKLPDDTLIWRYLSIEKFLNLLANRTLFLCRADQFEDKAEVLVSDIERDYYPKAFLNEIEKNRKRVFISSWIKGKSEVSTMWGAFAPKASGIAIKSSIGRLKKCYTGELNLDLLDVRYIDHSVDVVQPSDRINIFFFYSAKRLLYQSENEVRVVYFGDRNTEELGKSIPIQVEELIEEIHLGPSAPSWYKSTVELVRRQFGYSFPVKSSDLLYNR